jgi:DNA processing protein
MNHEELLARIGWALVVEPGDSRVLGWWDEEGPLESWSRLTGSSSPRDVFRYLNKACPRENISEDQVGLWRRRHKPEQVEQSDRVQQSLGIVALGHDSPDWPVGFNDLGPYAPHTLWVRGELAAFAHGPRRWLGVVGSRNATPQGLLATSSIVHASAPCQVGIVSGGAIGVDQRAHQSALDSAIPTLAVLAGGLERLYPATNAALFSSIISTSVLLAEAPCTKGPRPESFLQRNRLIAALSNALVVTEAQHRSGAVNTASHATALGRLVGVVPGRWVDENTAGCFRIARELGAAILTEPDDLVMLLN